MVAVVGGRGFIGQAIVSALRANGDDAVTVTHSRDAAAAPGFRYGDMLRPATLREAVRGASVVVQSANFRSYPFERRRRGETFMAFDGVGTEQLVAAARDEGVRRYVFVSGAGARDGGQRPYWEALRRGEDAVLGSGMEAVCVEPTLVFGPHDRGINRILDVARRARVVPMLGSGEQLHQPVLVDDVAELVRRALPPDAPQGVFAIGGPDRLSMDSLVRLALATANIETRIVYVPVWFARLGAGILRWLPRELLSPAALDFALEDFVADVEPAVSTFGISLTPLGKGLASYLSRA